MEDNPADAGLVKKALEEHQFEGNLMVVRDGETAIHFIHALDGAPPLDCPDLVILDLNLPKKSGKEVLETMRRSEKCRHVPVIILSSSDAAEDRLAADRLRATGYIRKPTRLAEFLQLGAVFKQALGNR